MFSLSKKFVTVTLHDPSRQITGFTRNNRLPVTIAKGETIDDALEQFNKFRSPVNQVRLSPNVHLSSRKVTSNIEVDVVV